MGINQISQADVPGVVMVGSALTFYKVHVSKELICAIITGQYPMQKTTVKRLIPPVPCQDVYLQEGMKPLENRYIILQCLEAFKPFVCPCNCFIA